MSENETCPKCGGSRHWMIQIPITVSIQADEPIDSEVAIDVAAEWAARSGDMLIPQPGPDNWARCYAEADEDEAQILE